MKRKPRRKPLVDTQTRKVVEEVVQPRDVVYSERADGFTPFYKQASYLTVYGAGRTK